MYIVGWAVFAAKKYIATERKNMIKRLLSIALSLSMLLTLSAFGSVLADEAGITLTKRSTGNTGAVLTVRLSGMSGNASVSAVSSDESIAGAVVDGGEVIVTGRENAVGIARITVTATDSNGESVRAAADVPVGYTTFVFAENSVTVIEGSDTNFEVVGQNPADEEEHALAVSADADGNAVYTNTDEAKLCVSIKKSGGVYVFSGTCAEGAIAVKKEATDNAFLLLNGLNLMSSYTSPITVKKNSSAAVVVTALAGTENTLSDAELNNADVYGPTADGGDGTNQFYAESAVIKAKTGATVYLNGEGTLNINGSAKNGVKVGADALLEVDELNLNVNAVNNGVSSENELVIRGGVLDITTLENDAIKADDDAGVIGAVTITGGDITINSADEGVAAAESVDIFGGTLDITSAGDAVKAENSDETAGDIRVFGGDITINSVCDGFQAAGSLTIRGGVFDILCCGGYTNTAYDKDTDPSAKGIKAGADMSILGGSFNINSADDALHSNADLSITGGVFVLSTTDDGVHADYTLTLGGRGDDNSAVDLTVANSCEGIEGATVLGCSGVYHVNSSDDCVNAANSDLSGYAYALRFHGGEYYCSGRSGDGLDSNGELSIYGGTVEVFCPGSGNGALDADGVLGTYGGTTLAVGKAEMPQLPSSGIYVAFGGSGMGGGPGGGGGLSSSFYEGDTLAIYNSSNVKLYETTVHYYNSNSYSNHVVFSDPGLVSGQTCYLYKNGTSIASAAATGSGSAPADMTDWQSVGTPSSVYNSVTDMPAGIGSVITNTAGTYALTGGGAVGASAITVSGAAGGYSISGVTEENTWYRDGSGRLYCTVDGTSRYLAYSSSGYGWNISYTVSLVTDPAAAPSWRIASNGSHAGISTTVSGGQGGFPGGGRTLYLTAGGSGFALSSSSGSVDIYSPDCAQAVLEGKTEYFINLDNNESITEARILANASIRFRGGINAEEEILDWTDRRVGKSWAPAFDGGTAGEYTMTVSVLGSEIGAIHVIIVSPNQGGGAPSPGVPEPPSPPEILYGDTDGDGTVEIDDALLALRAALNLITLDDGAFTCTDMDGDGAVSTTDALLIMRLALGV